MKENINDKTTNTVKFYHSKEVLIGIFSLFLSTFSMHV